MNTYIITYYEISKNGHTYKGTYTFNNLYNAIQVYDFMIDINKCYSVMVEYDYKLIATNTNKIIKGLECKLNKGTI